MSQDEPLHQPDSAATRPLSRRRLLQAVGASAGLVVAWSSAPGTIRAQQGASTPGAAPAAPAAQAPPTTVDSYLSINQDGTITLATGKVEYGQGIQTGFSQLVAEELDVPFEQITVIMGITDQAPFDIGTFGSQSTRKSGVFIRQAAGELHQWLLELGAQQLGLPADQVMTHNGAVVAKSDTTKTVPYAALAAGKKSARELSANSPLKDPATYTIVGQGIPRVDVPLKVNGSMKYGYDAAVDGMVHGKVVRPPALGSTLQSIDFSEAEKMPGVVGTFHDGDFAGLAAERRDQVESAYAAIKATWSEVNTGNTSENIYDLIRSTPDAGQVQDKEPGDPDTALANVPTLVSETFRAPYVSHTPLEPKSALVQITPDRVNVWTSTQAPFGVQTAVADLLKRSPEQVVVTPLMAGGAFGSKTAVVPELEAAKLTQALGRPVKIQWSREEEFQFGTFRPAAQIEVKAGLDQDGNVAGWKLDLYSAGYFPEGAEKATSASANANVNIIEIYNPPNALTTWYQGQSPLPPEHWRGNGSAFNSLARESVIDQLAEQAGQDPVSFRTKMLGQNPRMQAVMEAAVAKAGWTPGVGSTGQGIGIALAFADETYVAEVAKVAVDPTSGQIQVQDFYVAADCGLVVNPEAATNQLEGSVIFSLSPTLREMVTFDNGKVTNASWAQYQPITIAEVPTIDVVFVEDKTQPMAGIGEPAVAPVTGAVSNAVYDAIGIRLRELPFTPDRVLAAINGQATGTPGATAGATPGATSGVTPIAAD